MSESPHAVLAPQLVQALQAAFSSGAAEVALNEHWEGETLHVQRHGEYFKLHVCVAEQQCAQPVAVEARIVERVLEDRNPVAACESKLNTQLAALFTALQDLRHASQPAPGG